MSLSVHLALHDDETSASCEWHIPEAHPLESWGDLRAFDGSAAIQQPMILPLYGGRTALDVVSALGGHPGVSNLQILKDYWKTQHPGDDFDDFWAKSLHDGLVERTASKPVAVSAKPPEGGFSVGSGGDSGGTDQEIVFRPDSTVWDGRFSNNGWLQELPKPITKLTWDNAALLAPKTAKLLGVSNEDVIELRVGERTLQAPVWILPGQAEGSVTVHLGYGRTHAGRVGNGAGVNAYAVRTSAAPLVGPLVAIRKARGENIPLATTQHHQNMEGRDLVREATYAGFAARPPLRQEGDAGTGVRRGRGQGRHPGAHPLPRLPQQRPHRLRLGHDDQPQYLHRLLDLHHRLPG